MVTTFAVSYILDKIKDRQEKNLREELKDRVESTLRETHQRLRNLEQEQD